jgi:hypothetical protein
MYCPESNLAYTTMRYSASTISLFALCIMSGCIWLKLFNEGASDKLQLTLFGATVHITRGILSRRLVWSMDIYTIIAAAAPLDYILRKGSSSWRVVGIGPCSKKRHGETRYRSCAGIQAYACHRYGASAKPDLQMMASCYDAFRISVKEVKDHVRQCHASVDLPWNSFSSCYLASMESHDHAERSIALSSVPENCIERFGVGEQFIEATENSESIRVNRVGDATQDSGSTGSYMQCRV